MPRIEAHWNTLNGVALLLYPLSLLFGAAAALRRLAFRIGLRRVVRFPVPVVVVGNITVGGTGKTPLVIWLAAHLREQGWRPGIVARGYRGSAGNWPQQVRADSDPATVGDEAVLLAARTGCPMCVGPDRPAAVAALLAHHDVDIVLSDDGLQHYALGRDLEIAVIDAERRLGNGLLLPAGPLREPRRRLRRVDLLIVNGPGRPGELSMTLHPGAARPLSGDRPVRPLEAWAGQPVHAVGGIGNPARFFAVLQGHGLQVVPHAFPDHHAFRADELRFEPPHPILMTEKDAVKCRRMACRDCWVVPVAARPDATFVQRLNTALKELVDGQKTAGHPGLPDL